jgi:hypothetical protein
MESSRNSLGFVSKLWNVLPIQSFLDLSTNLLFIWVCSQVPFPFEKQVLLTAQACNQHLGDINVPKAEAKRADFQSVFALMILDDKESWWSGKVKFRLPC